MEWVIALSPSLISAGLVLIGWKVLYGNAKRISSRSETHALYQQLCKLLYDIEELSEVFWIKGDYNHSPSTYEILVLNKIKRLNQLIIRIKQRDINPDISSFLLRKSCTLHSYSIKNQGDSTKRTHLETIHSELNNIEQKISDAILRKYPHI
ncbi:hypothetical protein OW492_00330 [Psychromonas sp. 14N.309.X.WAT.B.A12]|uniref:hypothetical protein n=1 Tax=Psychromonas sp. 14N.309.X.WAT.B.A12 TaxID=2998322 RepID=UPI0025AEEF58|nr:hypothetical protein [Psychromonas sp. 14N.309.X.WAT.B.A12]MDN2661817.1 hypothetical protein [Psychromonas sp. 14N.309.X.WAT.B.A12]